ncbi:MAG: 2-oxoacid:acceptor oxidoreductase family protein [Candidatus Omnitrophota bacterium]
MKEIRIHARAGQGAITTAVLLGETYFREGRYTYCFPHFGAARMGAPMNAYVRVDEKPVRLRSKIYEPDYVLIADSTLMRGENCFSGLKEDGVAIINEGDGMQVPKQKARQKIYVIPGNKIAMETIGRPLVNTVLIGAFAAATGQVKLEDVIEAIKKRMKGKMADTNIEAAKRGFDFIKNYNTPR